MASIDPLFSVACDDCRRSYLARVDDLVHADSGCPVCGGQAVRVLGVPDGEDMRGLPRRALASDVLEYSRRLRQDSRRLRLRSAMVTAAVEATLAATSEQVAAALAKRL